MTGVKNRSLGEAPYCCAALLRGASISGYATSHSYATALGDASAKKPENGNNSH
jgi:hypothetical protein